MQKAQAATAEAQAAGRGASAVNSISTAEQLDLAVLDSDGRRHAADCHEGQQNATGSTRACYWSPTRGLLIVADNLPVPPPGRIYQVWVIGGGKPISAGLLGELRWRTTRTSTRSSARHSPDKVTLIANFIPLEAPYGGPNFFKFDDNVLYEIMVDNNGDAVEDVTFQFRFRTETSQPEHVPLQHRPDHVARRRRTSTCGSSTR